MKTKAKGEITVRAAIMKISSDGKLRTLPEFQEEIKRRFDLTVMTTTISAKLREIDNDSNINACKVRLVRRWPNFYEYGIVVGSNSWRNKKRAA